MKPTAEKARPMARPTATAEPVINPGDLVCGQCGGGNDPERKFCRRCGASLKTAVVFALPWYKKLARKLRRRKVRQAGERPRTRRRMFGGAGRGWVTSWFTRIIALIIIAIVVLAFVGPWKHHIRHDASAWYHDVANVIHPSYNQVTGIQNTATATSSAPGHPPVQAIDGKSNTSWWTGGAGDGQTLTFTPDQNCKNDKGKASCSPPRIDKVGFLIGDQDKPGAFDSEARPTLVELTFHEANGKTYTKSKVLNDESKFQSFSVKGRNVTSVSVTIEAVAGGNTTSAAIAEIELFGLQR